MKCENCNDDISDYARNVSKHVLENIPNPQPKQRSLADETTLKYPPEMKYTNSCPDCHVPHKNLNYKEPTLECNDCESELDISRESCPYCGSEETRVCRFEQSR